MIIEDVMKELAEVVADGTDLGRKACFWYPEKRISPDPAAWLIMLPEDIEPNSTYGRGVAEATLDGYLIAPTNNAETTVTTLVKYMNTSGENSIVEAIQTTKARSYDVARVRSIRNEPVTLFSVIYFASRYKIDIRGSGK